MNDKIMNEEEVLKAIDDAIEAPRSAHKQRVTIMLDGDVIDEIKRLAEVNGLKYQPFLNKFLKEKLFGETTTYEMMINGMMKDKRFQVYIKNVATGKDVTAYGYDAADSFDPNEKKEA